MYILFTLKENDFFYFVIDVVFNSLDALTKQNKSGIVTPYIGFTYFTRKRFIK